ncbi:MAG: aspartate aminotransferase family protein [Alphaproteobacteria bacterium]|nr:aspartate aminotransferase family protein [Alphaproteobacteria bacterium]
MFPAVLPTYNRADVAFVRGEGPYLFAEDGKRYLDFGAGIAVAALGHAHPHLVEALREQAGKLWHTSNLYRIPGQERLARRLVEASFADTVFFTNSGVEAIECAIKMARRYQYGSGHAERFRIITFEGAFHGRTLTALAAGNQAKYLEGFGPKVDGFDQVPFGDFPAVEKAVTAETAAILIEPVQGESGIKPARPEFLRALRRLCDDRGLLLIFDEVQTGVGRTGALFAHERSGVTPDIMAVAKGIGGGFPMGACLATEKAAAAMTAGSHASTFGGNPLAMAAGNATLDVVLAPEFLERVRQVGNYMCQQMAGLAAAHPGLFEDVRGEGLMLGLKMKVPNTAYIDALRAEGLLAVGAGDNVVRFLPPLIISEAHVREAMALMEKAAAALENQKVAAQ